MIILTNENSDIYEFYKVDDENTMWSVRDGHIGPVLVSFDKKKIYNLWCDFPNEFTKDQIAIFKKEMPFWYNMLKSRLKNQ